MRVYIQVVSSDEIFCCSFLVKNLVVCVRASTAKQIVFLNHRNRNVVGGTHNVQVHYVNNGALNLSGDVLCDPFI